MTPASAPFDRQAVRHHRARAAQSLQAEFLYDHIAETLADRLLDIKRDFPRLLELGSRSGSLGKMLPSKCGKELYVQTDFAESLLFKTELPFALKPMRLVCDEEALPFQSEQFDCIIAGGGLHWVNDLPGTLRQIQQCLVPDGLFMGALIAGQSLSGLREAFMGAEADIVGGAHPRFSPTLDLRDAAGLLQRAGFTLPVADTESLKVSYSSPLKLFEDLRAMGETNAHTGRSKSFLRRDVFMEAMRRYAQTHTLPDGRIEATFEILYLTGWRAAPNQQQPLKPGSGQISFNEVLN